jgi:hypothetical protein
MKKVWAFSSAIQGTKQFLTSPLHFEKGRGEFSDIAG